MKRIPQHYFRPSKIMLLDKERLGAPYYFTLPLLPLSLRGIEGGEVRKFYDARFVMYSLTELSKVYYLNITKAHVEALADLVAPVLEDVQVTAPISTSELLRRLGCELGEGKGLATILAEVRRVHPRWCSIDPKRTFMKKPCYLWHAPRPMTQQERAMAVRQAEREAAGQRAAAIPERKASDVRAEQDRDRERIERLAAAIPECDHEDEPDDLSDVLAPDDTK